MLSTKQRSIRGRRRRRFDESRWFLLQVYFGLQNNLEEEDSRHPSKEDHSRLGFFIYRVKGLRPIYLFHLSIEPEDGAKGEEEKTCQGGGSSKQFHGHEEHD